MVATTTKVKKTQSKSLKRQTVEYAIDANSHSQKVLQQLTGYQRETLSDWDHAS